jgi:hypothetical protein
LADRPDAVRPDPAARKVAATAAGTAGNRERAGRARLQLLAS